MRRGLLRSRAHTPGLNGSVALEASLKRPLTVAMTNMNASMTGMTRFIRPMIASMTKTTWFMRRMTATHKEGKRIRARLDHAYEADDPLMTLLASPIRETDGVKTGMTASTFGTTASTFGTTASTFGTTASTFEVGSRVFEMAASTFGMTASTFGVGSRIYEVGSRIYGVGSRIYEVGAFIRFMNAPMPLVVAS